MKEQPKLITKLTKLFGFKNDTETKKFLNISDGTGRNLNSGRAGRGLKNGYRLAIALAEEIPQWRLKEIISNMNFKLD